ncbi:8467_t:CDS:2 [Scutellospora calospora]|uniref:8467_t:CDS:1 n=1 Tax=Scutellospora calospora TaxID=85575 RepID=A0ACA9K9D3_9GLOM|nr:8467_t:CDS:2 [Scutellospora calospora]
MSRKLVDKMISFKQEPCIPVLNNVTFNLSTLPPRLPFPPNFNVATDIVSKRKPSQINLKAPNAFLIYRKVFLDYLCTNNPSLKMTDVSKLVSIYWKSEPELVKSFYKDVSHQVESKLNEKRKANVSFCRVIWKNSKLSGLSKQKRKVTRKKRQFNFSTKISSANSSRSNIFYEFVNVTPETILASKPSTTKIDNSSLSTNNLLDMSSVLEDTVTDNENCLLLNDYYNNPEIIHNEELTHYNYIQNLYLSQNVLDLNCDRLDYNLQDFSELESEMTSATNFNI